MDLNHLPVQPSKLPFRVRQYDLYVTMRALHDLWAVSSVFTEECVNAVVCGATVSQEHATLYTSHEESGPGTSFIDSRRSSLLAEKLSAHCAARATSLTHCTRRAKRRTNNSLFFLHVRLTKHTRSQSNLHLYRRLNVRLQSDIKVFELSPRSQICVTPGQPVSSAKARFCLAR